MRYLRRYNISPQAISQSGSVNLDPLTNGFTVQNQGTVDLYLNGLILVKAGGSFSLGGNEDEIYSTGGRCDIQFVAGAGTRLAVIIVKAYMGGEGYDNALV